MNSRESACSATLVWVTRDIPTTYEHASLPRNDFCDTHRAADRKPADRTSIHYGERARTRSHAQHRPTRKRDRPRTPQIDGLRNYLACIWTNTDHTAARVQLRSDHGDFCSSLWKAACTANKNEHSVRGSVVHISTDLDHVINIESAAAKSCHNAASELKSVFKKWCNVLS